LYRPEKMKLRKRYVISTQQVAVTIASGSTTGTQTINWVDTTTSFLVWGGLTASGANATSACAYIQLTNATTVTATRFNSNSDTVTVYCTVYFCTRRLIKSIQQGTAVFTSGKAGGGGSGTAGINAVNTTKAIALYLGNNSEQSGITLSEGLMSVTLTSATQVTTTLGNAPANDTFTCGYVVVEFQSEAVTKIQANNTALGTNNLSDTVTLSPSFDATRTLLFWGGLNCSTDTFSQMLYTAQLTNGSTITLTRNAASTNTRTIATVAVEFAHGVLKAIARGTTVLSSATSATNSITPTDFARAGSHQLGYLTSGSAFTSAFPATQLTDQSTLTTKLNSSGSATASWEAAWFN
jgi:hypothetical protein